MTVLTKVKVSKKEDEPAQTHLVEDKPEDNMEKGVSVLTEIVDIFHLCVIENQR